MQPNKFDLSTTNCLSIVGIENIDASVEASDSDKVVREKDLNSLAWSLKKFRKNLIELANQLPNRVLHDLGHRS